MRSTARLVVAVVATIPCVAGGQATEGKTMCMSEEKVVFSCALLPRKVVSLCLSREGAPSSLIYRFGMPGRNPELSFQAPATQPTSVFKTHSYEWSKGSYNEVSFSRGGYVYVVYNRQAVFSEDTRSNGGGVEVHENGKVIRDYWCHDPSIEDHMSDELPKLKLQTTERPVRAP